MMRSSTPITSKLFAFLAIALFAAPHVGTAADDLFFPSISPTATASPFLLSKGDKTPSETPTMDPSGTPSINPSVFPSKDPSEVPSMVPSQVPTMTPSMGPSTSMDPSDLPSMLPSSSLSPTTEAEKGIKIFNYTGILESYTIPEDGVYTFGAVGAKGGDCNGNGGVLLSGGYGARASGTFALHKGDEVKIIVGGKGGDCRKVRKDLPEGKLVDGRNYLEAATGAGGGGASSVRVNFAADGREDVLLVAGGGGGSAYYFKGEDGESGRNGGWPWGGKGGQGGGLGPSASPGLAVHGGASGGGAYGNGASRSSDQFMLAEGGESLSGGGRGGFVDFSDDSTISGGHGGFGSGAQGGFGRLSFIPEDNVYAEDHGGGGGGGGFSGGGAGPHGGNGAGGGGSLGVDIERHVGGGDGYVAIEKARASFVFFYEGARKQTVRAPKSGRYTITAVGAKGGNCDGCKKDSCKYCEDKTGSCKDVTALWCYKCEAQFNDGGYGALAKGTFQFRKGDEIVVRVGGKGQDCERGCRIYSSGSVTPDDRNYLEAINGAGGGGRTSVTVNHDDGGEDLCIVAGGGGGSAYFFPGEDGEVGLNGGFDWGGVWGQGGRLEKTPPSEFSGAGGGGMFGNGASVRLKHTSSGIQYDENGEVWAEGGFSLSNLSRGGYVYRDAMIKNNREGARACSGSAGGYGGGGQGGTALSYLSDRNSVSSREFRGAGGGGGGLSGGGAGPGEGDGAGGGGSFVADNIVWPGTAVIEGHKGDRDGYVIIEFEEDDTLYAYTGSKETVTIAEDGDYELTAVGGRGGSCNVMTLPNGYRSFRRGGYGAEARGTFRFSKGDQLHIVVGGKGGDCNVISENLFNPLVLDTTGAGGAGGTFIEWEEGTSNKQELLLVAGGGGGAGKDFDGGDGEVGPNGGFDWGGKNGKGGGLSCQEVGCDLGFSLSGGAGGGGYDGDGASRCGDVKNCQFGAGIKEICSEVNMLAEGGKSFQDGSEGGQQVVDVNGSDGVCNYKNVNGGFGGFGGGGEGGLFRLNNFFEVEYGGGGGGGGFSGGGAGQFQGLGGGGGGSYFNDGSDKAVPDSFSTTEKVGKSDGYVIIRMKVPPVLGGPGPGPAGKSGKKEEKAKSGKLAQGTLFT